MVQKDLLAVGVQGKCVVARAHRPQMVPHLAQRRRPLHLRCGLGFRVEGLGFMVEGLGFRVWGLGFKL